MKRKLLEPKNLRKYQWRAIKFALRKLCCALFLDMGLGKTIIVLSVIKALLHRGALTKDKPVLLVGPIRVIYSVWAQEAIDWLHTRGLTFSLMHGTLMQRIDALEAKADIYMINPENLVWLLETLNTMRTVKKWPFQMLVVDESSMFKSVGSKRFSKLRHFVHLFDYRVVLSGTPTPNSLLELWPQMFLVDKGKRLGEQFTRFKPRFFEPEDIYSDYPRYVPRKGAAGHIYELVSDVALSMEAKDWLEFPPTISNFVKVKLPAPARELYDEFEKKMFIQLDRGDVEAVSAATVSMKCHQLANGAIYSKDREGGSKIWEMVHNVKMEALEEIVAETHTPILVGYWFKHDFWRLRKRFPKARFFTNKKGDTTEDEWNNGDIDVLLTHFKSAAHGMNLQKGPGHTIALFSYTWSYELYIQLINRIGGARAQQRVMVHHIHAENTVDNVIMEAVVTRKASGNNALMKALKGYRHAKRTASALV